MRQFGEERISIAAMFGGIQLIRVYFFASCVVGDYVSSNALNAIRVTFPFLMLCF